MPSSHVPEQQQKREKIFHEKLQKGNKEVAQKGCSRFVTEHRFVCLTYRKVKQTKTLKSGAEKSLFWDYERRKGGSYSQNPELPQVFQQNMLKGKVRERIVGCCKLLCVGILCSCCCPCRSGHCVPVNPPQDKYYSLFCKFLSLYERESVMRIEVRFFRWVIPYISGYRQYS